MNHSTLLTRVTALLIGLSACAPDEPQSVVQQGPDAGHSNSPDAASQQPQQPPPPPPSTHQDAGVPTPPADACVPQVTQLLLNPMFDLTPQGKNWVQTTALTGYKLITPDDGVVEHSAPYKAWLGGFDAPTGTITDSLVQDVVIPPLTTALVLTGVHDVRTGEVASTTAYDTAKILITDPHDALITTVLSLSNVAPTTAWTMFGHAITQDLSGRTVRVKLTSTSDTTGPTSFFFDSLALTATHGCAPLP